MTFYDDNLRVLQERVQRKAHLEPKLEELKKQKKELEPKFKRLEMYAHNEQIDVDNLEGKTLASFFYNVIGKKEEKLNKERAEAYAFAVKRDNAKRELDEVNAAIASCESELASLANCEREYAVALDKKLDFIKSSGQKDADHRFILEERISYCDNQLKEINEALAIVENAKDMAIEILNELSDAENWGDLDMFTGGKIADMKKYDHIENAEMLVSRLKKELLKLQSEIADVALDTDIDVSISEFSSTADWLFDNIFTAASVLDQIHSSQKSIRNTLEQIKSISNTLITLKDNVVVDKAKLQVEYEALH